MARGKQQQKKTLDQSRYPEIKKQKQCNPYVAARSISCDCNFWDTRQKDLYDQIYREKKVFEHRFVEWSDIADAETCPFDLSTKYEDLGLKGCEKETTQRRGPLVLKGPVHTDMEVGAERAVYHEVDSILCAEERVCRSSASNSNPAWLVGEKVYFLQSILCKQLPINQKGIWARRVNPPEDAEARVMIEHWREGIIVLLVS
ncbi:uncharacterized protein [Triticum aestivum]|uniref:uncharacterized protein n=1 Tax=Triticum aestivum TaxID=4565 RepID=UPI001D00FC76|nr:uncharacterized protein LOC123188967 [Triticum aestivum]XP_044457206.1 uncharacterized protein LOC123188967 [Triticum aestivum]